MSAPGQEPLAPDALVTARELRPVIMAIYAIADCLVARGLAHDAIPETLAGYRPSDPIEAQAVENMVAALLRGVFRPRLEPIESGRRSH